MSIKNNTVGTTEITPVETEVTKSMKQESRDISCGRFKNKAGFKVGDKVRYLMPTIGGLESLRGLTGTIRYVEVYTID